MASGAVRPFPWGSLDAVRPADVAALQGVRRWAATHTDLAAARLALEAMLETPVAVRLRRAQRGGRVQPLDDGVAVVLAGPDDADSGPSVLIEAEGSLAVRAVALALKRRPPALTAPSTPPSSSVAGAFAAVLVKAWRRSGTEHPLRVRAAGPSPTLAAGPAAKTVLDTVTVTVLLSEEAFVARVTLAPEAVTAGGDRWGRNALASLGEAELEIPIVASAGIGARADVERLAPGDAWIPHSWTPKLVEGLVIGPLWLAPPDGEVGICVDLGEDHRLVVRGGAEVLPWTVPPEAHSTQEGSMAHGDTDKLVEALGDVPVVVRVEIGTARMRAREWAALGEGDVVTLGRRVGEPVLLRVGGAEVARGELVEIEGQVGVRILARGGEGGSK